MIEEEKNLQADSITYMLFGDSTASGWRVQAIPTNRLADFENRLPLPAEWRSLRDEELSRVSGIPDCVFVHTSGRFYCLSQLVYYSVSVSLSMSVYLFSLSTCATPIRQFFSLCQ